MNSSDPLFEALVARVVEAAVAKANAGAVPYPWVVAVCSFFSLLLAGVTKWGMGKDAALTALYISQAEEQKAVAVALDRATEALAKGQGRAT